MYKHLPDGSTVQIVASGPLLTFLVIQKQQNGSRVLYGMASRWWANGVPSFSLSQNFFLRLIPKTFSLFISSQNFTFQICLKTFSLLLIQNLAKVIVLCICVLTYLHLSIVCSINSSEFKYLSSRFLSLKRLLRKMHSHTDYIYSTFLHYVNIICVFVCLCICVFVQ